MDAKIEAILKKYREALQNDEPFSVLKQIRDELNEVLRSNFPTLEEDADGNKK